MIWKATGAIVAEQALSVSLTCPGCGHKAIFSSPGGNMQDLGFGGHAAGFRLCPDPLCRTITFVIRVRGPIPR
jgi:predicted RNA-binding Zn-ribbon protein involved in translation (DUF1610 family)